MALIIPEHCKGGPFHDLSTRLGRAYERYMVLSESVTESVIDQLVAAKLRDKSACDYHEKVDEAKQMVELLNSTKHEALKELKEAKKEVGQF